MESEACLVLAPNADDYAPLLKPLRDEGLAVSFARTADEATETAADPGIVLGQPDLVAAYLAAGKPVRWVQSTWAGISPLLDLGRTDYRLTGVRDTFGAQISEYVLGYLLAFELNLLERLGRQANRSWWPEAPGTLSGKTMGILGTGSIGRHLAATAAVFGVNVVGLNRHGGSAPGFSRTFPVNDISVFLAMPDYLVCTLPETPETRGLLNAETLAAVRRGCYLVNVGRGGVIDEEALLDALSGGRLAGAALDVFGEEPLPAYSPLWHAPDTLVTAHVAARSRPADIAAIFIENFGRFVRGEPLKYRIDFDRGY